MKKGNSRANLAISRPPRTKKSGASIRKDANVRPSPEKEREGDESDGGGGRAGPFGSLKKKGLETRKPKGSVPFSGEKGKNKRSIWHDQSGGKKRSDFSTPFGRKEDAMKYLWREGRGKEHGGKKRKPTIMGNTLPKKPGRTTLCPRRGRASRRRTVQGGKRVGPKGPLLGRNQGSSGGNAQRIWKKEGGV